MLRKLIQGTLVASAIALFASPALAQVQITGVAGNGSGCPGGSVDVLILGSEASVLFGRYNVSTTPERPIQTLSCNLRVGLGLQPGLTVSLTQITWQGTMDLGSRSRGNFNRTLGFAGQNVVSQTRRFGPGFTAFNIVDRVGGVTVNGCQRTSAIAGANTAISVRGPGSGELQSADIATFSRMILTLGLTRADCAR
jgi:hypothetical protein